MAAKYRVGVIGHTGRGNYGHGLDTVWLAMPETQIVGVADADDAGRNKAVQRLSAPHAFADYRELFDKTRPDIVSIGPRWLDQHRDIVVAAAERGIHIYLEKPLCRTLKEADQMVAICTKHNVKLALACQTRYSPLVQVIRDLIHDDTIGKVLEFRGRGKEDRRGGGEDLWVLGTHILNLMNTFGGDPQWCFATVRQDGDPVASQHVKPGNEEIGLLAGDEICATYGLDDGVTGYFGSHRNVAGNPRRFALQILGSKGIIELTTGYLPDAVLLADSSWSPGRSGKSWTRISSNGVGKEETIKDPQHNLGNIAACRDLIDAIEQDRDPECSIYEGRMIVEMIAGVFESHRQKSPVGLPLKTRENPLGLL